MSFVKLQPENFDTFSLTLRPRAEFTSSSIGVTGSVHLIERPSTINKRTDLFIDAAGTRFFDETNTAYFRVLDQLITNPNSANDYIRLVNGLAENQKNNIVIPVQRITQSIDFDRNSFTKSTIKNVLMPQYRSVYTDCDYAYKNYHTINFFTSSTVPSDSAIIYPNIDNQYSISSSFSVDFYINPRYLADAGSAFNAGTILHMSSSLCLALHTGSHKNANGIVDTFKLSIGFKHSANVSPSTIDFSATNGARSFPQDLIYVSDDNLLKHNNWHHVSVRWGNSSNNGTGSFHVDALTSSFYYPSSSIVGAAKPGVVILGNQYLGTDSTDKFFNATVKTAEGLTELSAGTTDPTGFTFSSPLNAEIHDVKIFNRTLTTSEIAKYRYNGASLEDAGLLFYVPPFFTNYAGRTQEDFVTPVAKSNYLPGISPTIVPRTPFNVPLAFCTQVFSPNLQNFLFDQVASSPARSFASSINYAPRLYKLTGALNTTVVDEFAVDHQLKDQSFAKRTYTILPCDNGLFTPNFDLLTSASDQTYQQFVDNTSLNNSEISLRNVDTTLGLRGGGSSIVESRGVDVFLTPDNFNFGTEYYDPDEIAAPGLQGTITTLLSFDTTSSFADTTSNLSTIYQISNLYYGNQIFPESFTLSSTALTGSGGKINITLKDNGFGGLYRADAVTPAPAWSTIGNLFYNEGLAIIKTPHLYYFGKDNFSVSFSGHQNIHTYTIDAICPGGEINSSSNPSYLSFPPTNEQNETADNFVYITGINIHDDNFNVIMRANLAQPVLKRPDEEFLFRLKYDM